VRCNQKLKKTLKVSIVQGVRSLKVIDVYIIQELVTSACYDKQYICAYLQLFSR